MGQHLLHGRKYRRAQRAGRAGRDTTMLALIFALVFALTACADPQDAVHTSVAAATVSAQAGSPSGPPPLQIATIGIGPTTASASAVMASRTVGALPAATLPTSPVSGTARATVGSIMAAAAAGSVTASPRAGMTAVSASSAISAAARGTPEPGVLLDPKGRYSFRIPTVWKARTPMTSGVDLEAVCDDPNGLLRATTVDNGVAVTLDSASDTITEALKKNTANYEPVPNGSLNAMIGGQPARRIEYYGVYSGTRLHYVSYVIVYGGKTVVTLLFVAQPDNFDRLLTQGSVVLTTFAFVQPK